MPTTCTKLFSFLARSGCRYIEEQEHHVQQLIDDTDSRHRVVRVVAQHQRVHHTQRQGQQGLQEDWANQLKQFPFQGIRARKQYQLKQFPFQGIRARKQSESISHH